MDLMQHGDDFLKYDLLREAKAWYQKALSLNVKTVEKERVREKIAECDKRLAYEKRVVWSLTALAALLILLFVIFKR